MDLSHFSDLEDLDVVSTPMSKLGFKLRRANSQYHHIVCQSCGRDYRVRLQYYNVPECPFCGTLDIE
jgi:rRNA maturation endonuclease Nob1